MPTDASSNPDGPGPSHTEDRNFLDHYFASIYTKLEADALLFNRQLPHAALVGAENENAIADVLRQFLPAQYGVEVNALVIDRFGRVSRQADIVIYDAANQARFFRKVFPVEIVYAVIEVKTSMSSAEAHSALENLASVSALEFHPALTPSWERKTQEQDIHLTPPALYVFAFRTDCKAFETFARWIEWDYLQQGVELRDRAPRFSEVRGIRVCALDKGVIRMESTNGDVEMWVALADDTSRTHDTSGTRVFAATVEGRPVSVDPAKALFMFMDGLWSDLQNHGLHPGFDIRTYMSPALETVTRIPSALVYNGQASD
jgi:hypothetical protein